MLASCIRCSAHGAIVHDVSGCRPHYDYNMQTVKPKQVFNPAAKGWMKDILYGDDPNSNFFIALLTKLTPKVCCRRPRDDTPSLVALNALPRPFLQTSAFLNVKGHQDDGAEMTRMRLAMQ